MAQIGSFVPAREAKLALVDRIFARVGASDNIARGQSTFMVEMQETASILHLATSRSLVVLDEIGRGTATFDGLSIAWAVAEYLASNARARPKTLFATHYHELTDLADALPGVVNYHVTAREYHDQIVFLRKIVPGRSDRSYGIQVARLAGLPAGVVARAREILDGLEQDELARGGRPTVTGAGARAGAATGPVRADLGGRGPALRAAARAGREPPDAARGPDAAGRPQARRGGLMRIRALAAVLLALRARRRRVAEAATRRWTSSRWPSPARPTTSTRASAPTRCRRRFSSWSTARCSRSTTGSRSSALLAERLGVAHPDDLRRHAAQGRAVSRRPRADVRRRRLHVHESARSELHLAAQRRLPHARPRARGGSATRSSSR